MRFLRCLLAIIAVTVLAAVHAAEAKPVKYVFLFIGDGMSIPQRMMTDEFLNRTEKRGLLINRFPGQAITTTMAADSFITDSAASGTAIACGEKTNNGRIGMDATGKRKLQSVAEAARDSGRKVGIVTSVTLNHATPAAFYGHNASRGNYYQLGLDLVASDFDYFGGGGIARHDDKKDKLYRGDIYGLARQAGYTVSRSKEEFGRLKPGIGKVISVGAKADLPYAIDMDADTLRLADFTRQGIELLDNPKGFFLMVEGGKIDWACHANDAAASIHDVLEMSNAVQTAVDFYNAHPNDTLILVTADHETGGMAIGYKTTNYDTFLTNLTHQKMSYAKFDSTYVKSYIANKTPFEAAMADVKANFGLTLPTDPDAAKAGKLLLTDYEVENLRKAYERTLEVGAASQKEMSQQDYELYGTYIPFSMAICHTINHKSGMDHTTYAHTGAMVNIYALGAGAEKFGGVFDNTEIFHKLAELTGMQ